MNCLWSNILKLYITKQELCRAGVYKVPKCPLRSGGKKGMKFPFCGNKVKKLSNFTIKKYFFEKKGEKSEFCFWNGSNLMRNWFLRGVGCKINICSCGKKSEGKKGAVEKKSRSGNNIHPWKKVEKSPKSTKKSVKWKIL